MKKKRVTKLVLFAVIWLMLSLSFFLNLTQYTANNYVSDIDSYSDGIMIADLIYHDAYPGNNYLLNALNTDVDPSFTHDNLVDRYLNNDAPPADTFQPYTSNVTIHRFLYRFINSVIPSHQLALQSFYLLNACLLALVLTIGIYLMYRWCRSWLWVAVASVSAAFFMPSIDSYSENMYWSVFVIFLPCVVTLWDAVKNHDALMAGQKRISHLFLISFLPCLLKNLFYFEFITTMMVSLMLPYLYLWCTLWRRETFRKALRNLKLLLVPAVGAVCSFVVALIVRVLLTGLQLGSLSAGISNLMGNLSYRLLDGSDTYQPSLQLIHQASQMTAISIRNVMDISFFLLWLVGLICLIFLNVFSFRRKAPLPLQPFALDVVFVCSSFGSVSWFIFANPHSNIHLWLTPLLFYIPTVFLLLFLISITIQYLVKEMAGIGQLLHRKDLRPHLSSAFSRLGVFLLLGAACVELVCWGDFLIVSGRVKSTAAQVDALNGTELYLDDSGSLYYVGSDLAEDTVLDLRLFAYGNVPSLTRQATYNAGQDCLEYQLRADDIRQTPSFFALLHIPMVGKVELPNYLYRQIDWAVCSAADLQSGSFSTCSLSTPEPAAPEEIQPTELTDANWTGGIYNLDRTIVLVSSDANLFAAIGHSYRTASGETVTLVDVIPQGDMMHLCFDQEIQFADGYPCLLSQA